MLPTELSGAILRGVFRDLCTSGEFGDFCQALQLRTVSRTFSKAFSAVADELQHEMLHMLSIAHQTKRVEDVFAVREKCLELHFCPIGASCETRKKPTEALLRLKSGKPLLLKVGAAHRGARDVSVSVFLCDVHIYVSLAWGEQAT